MIIAVIFQFKQLERRSLKKSGLQRDSNPWPPRYRCDALPTELCSHTLGARSIYWVHISREGWYDVRYTTVLGFRLLGKLTVMIHSSLSSTTAVQIWIISYILHINECVGTREPYWKNVGPRSWQYKTKTEGRHSLRTDRTRLACYHKRFESFELGFHKFLITSGAFTG